MKNWFCKLSLRSLFLLDAAGALLSLLVLLLVVLPFQPMLGISYDTIHLLAIVAGFYFVYSILGYLFLHKKGMISLKIIAVLNCLYALFIVLLLFFEYSHLTFWGVLYMLGDAAIVLTIGVAELLYTKRGKAA
ncbi:MAG: hypothetical protein R2800_06590 [Flavipsychrobacter sp.]